MSFSRQAPDRDPRAALKGKLNCALKTAGMIRLRSLETLFTDKFLLFGCCGLLCIFIFFPADRELEYMFGMILEAFRIRLCYLPGDSCLTGVGRELLCPFQLPIVFDLFSVVLSPLGSWMTEEP